MARAVVVEHRLVCYQQRLGNIVDSLSIAPVRRDPEPPELLEHLVVERHAAADHDVLTRSTHCAIRSATGNQDVISGTAKQMIMAGAAQHDVITRTAIQMVSTLSSVEEIVARSTSQMIAPSAAANDVVSRSAVQHVATWASIQHCRNVDIVSQAYDVVSFQHGRTD